MKKSIILFIVLFFKTNLGMFGMPTHKYDEIKTTPGIYSGMYDQGGKLKFDEIKLTNKSPMPLKLSWIEISRPQGSQQTITKEIPSGETVTVKIGKIGGYSNGELAKIIYRPMAGDPSFKEYFSIDLPNSSTFVFTAVTLADVFKDILVPVLFQPDDEGKANSFQYMIGNRPNNAQFWGELWRQIGKIKAIS